jgi:hypothetical protein
MLYRILQFLGIHCLFILLCLHINSQQRWRWKQRLSVCSETGARFGLGYFVRLPTTQCVGKEGSASRPMRPLPPSIKIWWLARARGVTWPQVPRTGRHSLYPLYRYLKEHIWVRIVNLRPFWRVAADNPIMLINIFPRKSKNIKLIIFIKI